MGRICGTFKCNHKPNKCGRFYDGFVNNKKGLVFNESENLIYELIKNPWKITSIHSRGQNIGIDKFIKIRSDNKLEKFYLKGIVYHEDFILSYR
jgi:hypothetical protein